ncbi:MAG TPA: DUF4388 domain-containing protein [Anaeromyxobacter sp.]|nr:DUF4388 domain-containing protein [Anaeromyxobacter sp.]
MALKGTLKDFGIAEILQLIGQQAKSGVLHLETGDDAIHIAISEGFVVRAESAGRKTRERLGTMLVRADLISKEELAYALDLQKKSLRRLGDILVEQRFVSKEDLRGMTALQTTETIYRLFHWESGTYEFEPGDVEWDRETVTPLRAESVLMEGYRQVDEWPLIRKKIYSKAMSFERLRPLDGDRTASHGVEKGADDVDAGLDGLGEPRKTGEFAKVGANERRVYELAVHGRTVEKIVDLSRLGEFETCKALLALVNRGYLAALPPAKGRAAAAVGAYALDWQARIRRGATRVAATVAIAAALAAIAYSADRRGLGAAAGGASVGDNAAQRFLARYQLERLRAALEVYRLERGEYPERLPQLVEAGLASGRDLRYPWRHEYYYRRKAEGRFILLPPVE